MQSRIWSVGSALTYIKAPKSGAYYAALICISDIR